MKFKFMLFFPGYLKAQELQGLLYRFSGLRVLGYRV